MKKLIIIFLCLGLGISIGYCYCKAKHTAQEEKAFNYGVEAGRYNRNMEIYTIIQSDTRLDADMKAYFKKPIPDSHWYCEWGEYYDKTFKGWIY
jgi:hypothetical protein